MHQTVLEEKRQIVLSKGRNGVNLESEREQIEGQLRQAYEDRLGLEEQAQAQGRIKGRLQGGGRRSPASLREAQTSGQAAAARAEGAAPRRRAPPTR